eukprot:12668203-Heterocapsa_arctica.AAC.1
MAVMGGINKEGKMADPQENMEWESATVVMHDELKPHRTCAIGDIVSSKLCNNNACVACSAIQRTVDLNKERDME